jgi:Bardet-Biedl syndrome 2 protein
MQLLTKIDSFHQIIIRTDDLEVAAAVVDSLARGHGADEVASTAEFPNEVQKLRDSLIGIDTHSSARSATHAESAEASLLIRSLVLRAEDARVVGDL